LREGAVNDAKCVIAVATKAARLHEIANRDGLDAALRQAAEEITALREQWARGVIHVCSDCGIQTTSPLITHSLCPECLAKAKAAALAISTNDQTHTLNGKAHD
jgi:rubrerythrin